MRKGWWLNFELRLLLHKIHKRISISKRGEQMKIYKNYYTDIEEIIGVKNSRFFGNGFSKVENQIIDIHINSAHIDQPIIINGKECKIKGDIEGYVNAKGKLLYPEGWSKKSDTELKPHLSTIDALNLSVQLNEIFLLNKYNLGQEDRKKMWLKKYSISAGNAPYEDLKCFDICTFFKGTDTSKATFYQYVSVFESHIGALKVYCEIEHPINEIALVKANHYDNVNDILGDSYKRYYGNGYRYTEYDIKNIKINTENETIENLINVTRANPTNYGFEGAYRPTSLSMIDSIILCGQISQALLYSIDKVDRSETGTLWMRKVTMESMSPFQACEEFLATTRIENGKIIKMKGRPWRKAEIHSFLDGINCEYSLAYELPVTNEK